MKTGTTHLQTRWTNDLHCLQPLTKKFNQCKAIIVILPRRVTADTAGVMSASYRRQGKTLWSTIDKKRDRT